jgi:RND family efflux transporter MFP subunit
MTRQDKRWLIVGILVGALIAGAAVAAVFLRLQRTQIREAATMPAPSGAVPASTMPPTGDGMQIAAQLSPEEQVKIGLQTTEIRRESLTEDIVVIGRVVEPETAIGTVSTRFGGRVERLFVTYAGQPVKKGEPVATIAISGQPVGKDDPVSSIYNRDLIAATAEYKFALENRQRAQAMSRPEAVAQADALVEASRVRLERFGIKPDQIDSLLARPDQSIQPEQPIQVTVSANSSGIVRSRKVTEGQFVDAGDALIELTDLSTVWVKADVFDTDLARIRTGLTATIQSEALPGVKLSGVVDFIDPQSDPQTRTTPVRIQVANPGTRLKPGMLVQPSFHLALGSVLTVPRDAVIDTGQEKVVYIARDNGVFQQQRIRTGTPIKDRYPVLEGLKEGEKVVTNGLFLVDSQTRLTGGLTGMFGGSKSYTDASSPAAATTPSAYKMTVRLAPDPPQGAKQNMVHVTLVDAAGKPVTDAQVRAAFQMPAMPAMNMPEMRNGTDLKWTGSDYVGPIQIMMAGGWNVTVEARRGNEVLTTVRTQINAR